MAKWHISKKSGNAGKCTASVRACPVGGEDDHFESEEDAFNAMMDRDPELKKLKKDLFAVNSTNASALSKGIKAVAEVTDSSKLYTLANKILSHNAENNRIKSKTLRLKLQSELADRGIEYDPVRQELASAPLSAPRQLQPGIYRGATPEAEAKRAKAAEAKIQAGLPKRVAAYQKQLQESWDSIPVDEAAINATKKRSASELNGLTQEEYTVRATKGWVGETGKFSYDKKNSYGNAWKDDFPEKEAKDWHEAGFAFGAAHLLKKKELTPQEAPDWVRLQQKDYTEGKMSKLDENSWRMDAKFLGATAWLPGNSPEDLKNKK